MSAEFEWQRSLPPTASHSAAETSARPPAPVLSSHQLAAQGWVSPLAIAVAGLAAIQTVTGLWVYVAPFSSLAQSQVLLHTAAGLLFILPFGWYAVHHFLVWRAQKATAVMVLGYFAAVLVTACVASGIVLTWQAAFGPKLGSLWSLVHLVSGFVTGILISVHLVLAFLRRRQIAREVAEFRSGVRRFVYGTAALSLAAGALVVAAVVTWPAQPAESPVPAGYSLSTYLEKFDEYRGNPFAPSYARTDSGNLIDPAVLGNSASCGTTGCHEQIYAEWQPSAHRFSAMNPSFQAIQKNFAADRGAEETRYCAGCHDPISLFAGAKDIHNLSLSAPGMQEGCSCVVCHAIDKVDVRGNADYVLVPPRKYLWEDSQGWQKAVSDFLIRAFPRQHLADYDRGLLHSTEFCGACHKQFIPEALNRFGMVAGQNQYDEWRSSHWNATDPAANLNCVDCHMRLVTDSSDPGRGEAGAIRRTPEDGKHRHHGFIATNFFMPQVLELPHAAEQVRLTEEWIRGETVIPEIEHLWPAGPVASLDIVAPQTARPGEDVRIEAVVSNRKAGHNLTTGPLDFMRVWIHLRVLDAEGRTIAEWGGIDPVTREITDSPGLIHQIGNSRKEGTLVLEGLPINGHGQPIVKHELWTQAGGKGKRVIFPGYTDHQSYTLSVPAGAKGPLVVKADLNFRRYRQEFLDLVLPTLERDTGFYQPMVAQSSDEKQIAIVPHSAE
ncbi:MAG: multiheme c-type cytochrome [Pirellulaceae bacterium]